MPEQHSDIVIHFAFAIGIGDGHGDAFGRIDKFLDFVAHACAESDKNGIQSRYTNTCKIKKFRSNFSRTRLHDGSEST